MSSTVTITFRRADGALSSLSVPASVHEKLVQLAGGDVRLVNHLLRRTVKALTDVSPGERSRISRDIVEQQLLLRAA